jgi:LuxR family maltose regulon positive regulatory protein
MSHIWRGDFVAGGQALERAVRMGQEIGNVMVAVAAMCHLAELRMFQGHLRQAKGLYEEALSLATDTQGQRLPIAGMALIGLGEIFREWNDLETATRYLEDGIELALQWGQIGALDGYIALARTHQALGDADGTAGQIQKAIDLAAMFDTTELDDRFVAAHQARLRIIQALREPTPGGTVAGDEGFPESVLSWGKWDETEERGGDDFTFRYVCEIEGFSQARLSIGQGRPAEALATLEQLRPGMQGQERRAGLIELRMLEALALQARGEGARAIAALEDALDMAGPEGYVRLFVDEGQLMARLLRRAAAQGVAPEYVGRLLAAFRPAQVEAARQTTLPAGAAPLVEPLVERELQVLRLIAAGLTNREIGEELFIATSTVKWHVNNLYGKLEVHNRTQAVARARELQLI